MNFSMTYTIGIGALINGPSYNYLRKIEVQIGDTVGNFSGLGQPPHVTIKRAFEVKGISGIRKCERAMDALANKKKPFDVQFAGVGNFGNSVLYLRLAPNDTLVAMHSQLLDTLEPVFPKAIGTLEGENMVFHSTIAMGLEVEQYNKARELLDTYPVESLAFAGSVNKLGLFLGIENNTHWAVISEADLTSDGV